MNDREDLIQYKKMLFSIAYNMLGTVSDAEDMVQETYTSWLESDKSHVVNAKFYLIRIVTNKCITHLNNIRKDREAYTGTWLPEPLVCIPDMEEEAFQSSLSFGFLYLLEKLTPIERGVIILKEAFSLPYNEISQIFDIAEENCRQHLSRAKKKLFVEKRRFTVRPDKCETILREFIYACENKNLNKLVELLREDVTAYADGGGKAPALSKPLTGKDNILKVMIGGIEYYRDYERAILSVNGLSGIAFHKDTLALAPSALITIETDSDNKIMNIFYIVNPEKLQRLNVRRWN
jgi:RNA polymerase sigma-70 factor (ECF subfamily)